MSLPEPSQRSKNRPQTWFSKVTIMIIKEIYNHNAGNDGDHDQEDNGNLYIILYRSLRACVLSMTGKSDIQGVLSFLLFLDTFGIEGILLILLFPDTYTISSTLIHLHKISSTFSNFIHFYPISSTLIQFHPLFRESSLQSSIGTVRKSNTPLVKHKQYL